MQFSCATSILFDALGWSKLEIVLEISQEMIGTRWIDEFRAPSLITLRSLKTYMENCERGEQLSEEGYCEPCERGFYSNSINITGLSLCISCLDSDPFFCYGGAIRSPKAGFWRPSEMSSNFLNCPRTESCVGDPYFLREEETVDFKLVKANFITMSSEFFFGYCEKGYQGVLCAECENKYGIGPSYTCEDCSS